MYISLISRGKKQEFHKEVKEGKKEKGNNMMEKENYFPSS
ncbi:hypothetical protein IC006_2398 [Sulfuracidifex tepidarius]|uniref:Uncharacterized protein n=1 Tax=Sulfuracidifex tepidarius TaxID=1294262 RepID=A0A510DXX4_9CREN|nr:hypothetical protein IC006_2398 [Sulfuracidifex tepidarius]